MPAKKAAGPSYRDLIAAAIVSLKSRTGSSLQAIKKFVQAKKGSGYVNGVFLRALKAGVAAGQFTQVKGSYKLSAAAKKPAPKKKPAKKKAPAKKKKAAPKKKKAPKKKAAPKKKKAAPKKKKAASKKK